MKVAVIGATGYGGSHLCIELLNRGYTVLGVSRHAEKLGKHEKYSLRPMDVAVASIEEIVEVFKSVDVVVNSYNPSPGPTMYRTFVETTRKLIVAAKASRLAYFLMIGGTGSLELPGYKYKTVSDSREFWLSYRRAVADSEAATKHMEDRIGPGSISDSMRAYRNARVALREGKASDEEMRYIKETEEAIKVGENWMPDLPLAARATFQMFEDNQSFAWSFVSPSPRYRPGPRTGKYEVFVDEVPLAKMARRQFQTPETLDEEERWKEFDGRLLGVSAADLAVAVVDEIEKRELVGKHWSPVSDWSGDEAMPTTITIQ